jgi:hypothetical protein
VPHSWSLGIGSRQKDEEGGKDNEYEYFRLHHKLLALYFQTYRNDFKKSNHRMGQKYERGRIFLPLSDKEVQPLAFPSQY